MFKRFIVGFLFISCGLNLVSATDRVKDLSSDFSKIIADDRAASASLCTLETSYIKQKCSPQNKRLIRGNFRTAAFKSGGTAYDQCVSEGFKIGTNIKSSEVHLLMPKDPIFELAQKNRPDRQNCLRHRLGWGQTKGAAKVGPSWELQEKSFSLEHYDSLMRAQTGHINVLQEMLEIDSLLGEEGGDVLNEVSCKSILNPTVSEQCKKIKKNKCKAKNDLAGFANSFNSNALTAYRALLAKQREHKLNGIMAPRSKKYDEAAKSIHEARELMESMNPWLKFKEIKKLAKKKSSTSGEVQTALRIEFQKNRKKLAEKAKVFNKITSCRVSGDDSECINLSPSQDQLLSTSEWPSKYEENYKKIESDLNVSKCLREKRIGVDQTRKVTGEIAISLGLTVATLGASSAVGGAKIAKSFSDIVKTTSFSRKKKAWKLFILGLTNPLANVNRINGAFLYRGLEDAYQSCRSEIEKVEKVGGSLPRDNSKIVCSKGFKGSGFKARDNLKSCVTASLLAAADALPFVPPVYKGLKHIKRTKALKGGAENILNRSLTKKEVIAIRKSHLYGSGKVGADGTAARLGNYTDAQKRTKLRILLKAGFSRAEAKKLADAGIVGAKKSDVLSEQGQSVLNRVANLDSKNYSHLNPNYVNRLQEFAENCLADKNCQKNTELLSFLERLASPKINKLPDETLDVFNQFSKTCFKPGSLETTCDIGAITLFERTLKRCLDGCTDRTLRQLKGFLVDIKDAPLPAKFISGKPDRAIGPREVNKFGDKNNSDKMMAGEDIFRQNNMATAIHKEYPNLVVIRSPKDVIKDTKYKNILSPEEYKSIMQKEGLSLRRDPDFIVNGRVYDYYRPRVQARVDSKTQNIDGVSDQLVKKVVEKVEFNRQTNRVVADTSEVRDTVGLKAQLIQAHEDLVKKSFDGSTVSHTYPVPKVNGVQNAAGAENYIRNKKLLKHGAFKPGQVDVKTVGQKGKDFQVEVTSKMGLRNTEEVVVILGSVDKPVLVRIYPTLDVDELNRGLNLQKAKFEGQK